MNAQKDPNQGQSPKSSRRSWLRYSVAGLAGALLGGTAVTAISNAVPGDWGHHRHGGFGGMARQFAERRIDHLLYELEATPEQRKEVQSIVAEVFAELAQVREQHRAGHKAFVEALAQSEIDRDALEGLRAGHMRLTNEASARIVQALTDAAEVLTPEQRARLRGLAGRFGPGRF